MAECQPRGVPGGGVWGSTAPGAARNPKYRVKPSGEPERGLAVKSENRWIVKSDTGEFCPMFYWLDSIFFFGPAAGGTVDGAGRPQRLPDLPAGSSNPKPFLHTLLRQPWSQRAAVPLQLPNHDVAAERGPGRAAGAASH